MGNCYPSVNAPSVTPTIEMSVDTIQLPCMICDRQFCPEGTSSINQNLKII